jgi:ribosome biogenesis GTPase
MESLCTEWAVCDRVRWLSLGSPGEIADLTGRVIKITGLLYHVKMPDETVLCSVRRSVKDKAEFELSPVVVGDIVKVDVDPNPPSEGEQHAGVITEVEPRKTYFSKKKTTLKTEKQQLIAANIDQIIVVASVKSPAFKMRLIDRFVITAMQGGVEQVVVVNKIDLKHDIDLKKIEKIYDSVGIEVIPTSARQGLGLDKLQEALKDKESVFVGQSGAGKSSLLNAIQPGLKLRTGDVSEKTGKGKHVTTVVELFPLDFGGYVVDTPGLRALGLIGLHKRDIEQFYDEISETSRKCRFSDCRHKDEPDCAVKAAVDRGDIYAERYESYIRILADAE